MLQEAQRTSAPSAVSVSMSTAVCMVMCSELAMRAPLRGWDSPNSARRATSGPASRARPGGSGGGRPRPGTDRRPCGQRTWRTPLGSRQWADPASPFWAVHVRGGLSPAPASPQNTAAWVVDEFATVWGCRPLVERSPGHLPCHSLTSGASGRGGHRCRRGRARGAHRREPGRHGILLRGLRRSPAASANQVIVAGRRGDVTTYAAVMVLATHRADVNGVVRRHLGARKISFAAHEDAVGLTGMEFGGITPVGLPGGWPILVDEAVGLPARWSFRAAAQQAAAHRGRPVDPARRRAAAPRLGVALPARVS